MEITEMVIFLKLEILNSFLTLCRPGKGGREGGILLMAILNLKY